MIEKQLVFIGKLFGIEIWAMTNAPTVTREQQKLEKIRKFFKEGGTIQ